MGSIPAGGSEIFFENFHLVHIIYIVFHSILFFKYLIFVSVFSSKKALRINLISEAAWP